MSLVLVSLRSFSVSDTLAGLPSDEEPITVWGVAREVEREVGEVGEMGEALLGRVLDGVGGVLGVVGRLPSLLNRGSSLTSTVSI